MNAPTEARILETKEAAIALSEDFAVLNDVVKRVETRPVDLRHTSVVLRRWLVENQLGRVASPRVGRLHINAIDNNPIYRAARSGRIVSFVSGGASVHGVFLAAGMMSKGGKPPEILGYHPDGSEEFKLDTFLKQRVIFSNGEWFTRQQVIKYVAHADHGAHGHGAKEEWEKRLAEFRQEVSISLVDGPDGKSMPSVVWGAGQSADKASLAKYDPSRINGVLIEVIATIHFLTTSTEVLDLMKYINAEMA
ncbi:MAG: hypothetical protein P8N68_06890 [Paracoccaceae bacterium]|nr:hypothetical protein [Paracoccaceae bacterium]